MSRTLTPDRRDQRQPKPQPKPGDRGKKPGDWVAALLRQIKERHK